jgi:type IV pilus assembly protein PilA
MFMTMHKRLSEKEDGFTLIELMVVVLIIAILIAVAIPTFLGARKRAQDRAAQSNLRNSLTNAKAAYSDSEAYPATAAMVTELTSAEPQLTFQTTASTVVGQVSVQTDTANEFAAAVMSKSGTCFFIRDVAHVVTGDPSPGVYYGSTTTAANCTGAQAAGATGAAW